MYVGALTNGASAIVLAVEYRKAPEAKFPAAHKDVVEAYQWTLANAASFGGDAKRITVVGKSAGGNRAANVAIAARDKAIQMPLAQVLVFLIADNALNAPSIRENTSPVLTLSSPTAGDLRGEQKSHFTPRCFDFEPAECAAEKIAGCGARAAKVKIEFDRFGDYGEWYRRAKGKNKMSEKTELEGKVALVTGAGEGIGKATAKLFAAQGAIVGVLGRTEANVRSTVEEINSAGGRASLIVADISNASEMEQVYEKLTGEHGRLDIVFANAGINGITAPIEEITPEEWRETIDNNLTGTFLTVKYAVPHLKKQGGAIVITASINGTRYFSNPGATAYSTSKAGQVAFAKTAALELAKHKIRVNVICPGAIETNISDNQEKRDLEREREPVETPEGDIPLTDGAKGKPEQVAELVLFLSSERAGHITGTPVFIDGAQSLLI